MGEYMRLIGFLTALALPAAALAEPVNIHSASLARQEGVVGIGLTLPFGGQRKPEPPRVELRIARDVIGWDGSRQSASGVYQAETRLGFQLAPGNLLTLNGRPIEKDRRLGLSTGGAIAIGVGVAVVAGVVLFSGIAVPDTEED
jgi:hypothetical protein